MSNRQTRIVIGASGVPEGKYLGLGRNVPFVGNDTFRSVALVAGTYMVRCTLGAVVVLSSAAAGAATGTDDQPLGLDEVATFTVDATLPEVVILETAGAAAACRISGTDENTAIVRPTVFVI